jgi:hypothetical protein
MAEAGNIKIETQINIDIQEVKVSELTREHIGKQMWSWNDGWETLKSFTTSQFGYEITTDKNSYCYEYNSDKILFRLRATLDEKLTPDEKNWLLFVIDNYTDIHYQMVLSIKKKLGLIK